MSIPPFAFATLIGLLLTMNSVHATDIDSKYFIRNTLYSLLKDKVVLIERDRPGVVTMADWPQLVFMSADGEHTVGQLISHLGKQYPNGVPPGLAQQTHQIIEDLSARGYIVLMSEKKKLPYYLATPVEEQDKEQARVQMEADGFIKKTTK